MINTTILTCLLLLQSVDNNDPSKNGSVCFKPNGSVLIDNLTVDQASKIFIEQFAEQIAKSLCK
jgi:hypothetical protein